MLILYSPPCLIEVALTYIIHDLWCLLFFAGPPAQRFLLEEISNLVMLYNIMHSWTWIMQPYWHESCMPWLLKTRARDILIICQSSPVLLATVNAITEKTCSYSSTTVVHDDIQLLQAVPPGYEEVANSESNIRNRWFERGKEMGYLSSYITTQYTSHVNIIVISYNYLKFEL